MGVTENELQPVRRTLRLDRPLRTIELWDSTRPHTEPSERIALADVKDVQNGCPERGQGSSADALSITIRLSAGGHMLISFEDEDIRNRAQKCLRIFHLSLSHAA